MIIGVDACPLVASRTGIGNFTHAVLEWLVTARRDVQFVLYSNRDIHFPGARNVSLRVLPARRRGAFWHHTRLAPALRADKVDLFWGTNGYLPLLSPSPTRCVLTVHDLVWYYASRSMPYLSYVSRRLFQPPAIRSADAIVAASESTSREVRRRFGRVADAVIHPVVSSRYRPAPIAEQRSVARKLGIEGSYLLAVGTLEPRKNFEMLIRAHMQVRARCPELPRLVIAGRAGWLQKKIRAQIARAEPAGHARWLGYVPEADMRGLYSGAVALILPSIYEGFGMPVLEAQLCGTPVMIADIPSLNEAAGGVAARFEPDFDSICEALLRLARGALALPRRDTAKIVNSAEGAGLRMWQVFESALMRRAA